MMQAPESTRLETGTVLVWSARLDPSAQVVAALEVTLSSDERARAERFAFPHLQRRFIVGRGLLRQWLASHLQIASVEVRFAYEPLGKPVLDACHGSALSFSVSHSADQALFALAIGVRVGVDIEARRPMADASALAERFFSASERRTLRGLPPAQVEAAFFACWTRKEAYVKATGEGLSCDLESFDVSVIPGERPRLLSIHGSSAAASGWTLESVEPATGFIGAVAVDAPGCRVRVVEAAAAAAVMA